MRIEPFQLERWMTKYEMVVRWDIAESGIYPMTMREIVNLVPPEERDATLEALLDTRLGYSEARGSEEFAVSSPQPMRTPARTRSSSPRAPSRPTTCCSTSCSIPATVWWPWRPLISN